ncbi:hypothetical protein V8F20_005154 [Naviculisporaceae sp. PSN 640]
MACPQLQGNAPLYGLGIRISFYLLWLSPLLLLPFLTPSSIPTFRLLSSFFIIATFFALILQSSWGTITALDAYITLLLTSGAFFTYIPIYVWKVLSMCNPFWDCTRWPRVPTTRLYKNVEMLTILAVSSYSVWFWGTGVKDLPNGTANASVGSQDCESKGFFFTPVPLEAGLFVAVNIVFAVALMVGALVSLGVDMGWIPLPRWRRKQERRFEREMGRFEMRREEFPWRSPLQLLHAISNTIVFTVVILAVELTIQWNNLTGDVSDISTSGQLIPLFVVVGFLLHAIYVWFDPDHDKVIREALGHHRHHHHHHRRKGSGGKGRSRSSSDKGGGGGGSVYVGVGVARPGRPYQPGGPAGGGQAGPGVAANVVSVEPGPQGV